ncbi:MAG TPA: DNA replication and repair protein RecF [Candidatus Dormibacteraeota bacterium]|nr:DNA replication and repair protein RecF [Candidatus Dormibacteraeota bacterium]
MIADIRLQNFRSYADASFELGPSINIIVGPNASGKTNLLEALLVLARGSSYRASDNELVAFNKPWARLDAHLSNNSLRTVKIIQKPQPAKSFEFDSKTLKRLNLDHTLPVVLFEPNHLSLLSGQPEIRRAYIDELLEQTVLGYSGLRREYRRALAQRNSLLKKGHPAQSQLFPWNVRLSELAGQVVRQRNELVSTLNNKIGATYLDLAHGSTKINLVYRATWEAENYQSNLLKKLETSTETDIWRGFTGSGPHREDLAVLFNNHPAQEAASRGEARTLVLGLKILELEIIKTNRGITPLLLMDDVFSELDGARRRALTNYLKPYQTFITTTDADVVVQNFTETCNILPIVKHY